MAGTADKSANALRQDLADLVLALNRKRDEVSNLKVGYIRAVEGSGPIPAEPLRRNLIDARAQLTDIEQRVSVLRRELGGPE